MKRAALAIAVVAATSISATGIAAAGTYVGLAVGPSLETSGDASYTSAGRTGKLLVGFSFGQLAVEAAALRGSLTEDTNRLSFDATQLSLVGKYSLPISEGFEAFGRAGFQRTALSRQDASDGTFDADGTGLILGAGIEYKLKLVATSASIFVDYTFASTTLNGARTTDTTIQTRGFGLGATVGF